MTMVRHLIELLDANGGWPEGPEEPTRRREQMMKFKALEDAGVDLSNPFDDGGDTDEG